MDYRDWTLDDKRAYAEQVRSRNRNVHCDCDACQRERAADLVTRVERLITNWSGHGQTQNAGTAPRNLALAVSV